MDERVGSADSSEGQLWSMSLQYSHTHFTIHASSYCTLGLNSASELSKASTASVTHKGHPVAVQEQPIILCD